MASVLKDAFSLTRLAFWTGMLLSSLVGCILYASTQRSIDRDAEERFNNHAKYAQSVISVRIKQYTDLLRATGSMLESSDVVSHEEFHYYIRRLDLKKNFPAVDSFNFALYIKDKQREPFIADMRAKLQQHVGPNTRFAISPPGNRSDYLIVSYFEPEPPTSGLYGIDLLANPYFGSQLTDARDDGSLRASGTRVPLLSGPNNVHLGMRMPIYRANLPLDTVEQRRAAYTGSLGIVFSVPELLRGVLDEMPVSQMRMTLYDSGPRIDNKGREFMTKPRTLFDSRGSGTNPMPALDTGDAVFSIRLPLDFNGRPWETVYSVAKFRLYTDSDQYSPKLMLAFGFIGSILLYASLHILMSSRRAALVLARQMTTELRESQHKLQLSHQKLRLLADHAYQIKEMERKRIAREIHDDLGQNLLALRIDAELLAARTRDKHSHLHKRTRATLQHIDVTIKSVRQIINDLRPTVLDLGLSAAVEWQVDQFQRRTGIQCEMHNCYGEIPLPDRCATAFFRILQESLTNIVRHAKASKVVVDLHFNDGWLSLTVKDNGCGLPPGGHNKFGSFGLVGIEERILILGGTCSVSSEPSGGTTVRISAPVPGPANNASRRHQEHEPGSSVI